MNLLCAMFGHRNGERGGAEYMRIRNLYADGIKRVHVDLWAKCCRCGQTYLAGAAHLPKWETVKEAEDAPMTISNEDDFRSRLENWSQLSDTERIHLACQMEREIRRLRAAHPPWPCRACNA